LAGVFITDSPPKNESPKPQNLRLTTEPENKTIQKLLENIRQRQEKSAVPSTIAQEKQTNVFLWANTPAIKAAVNMPETSDAEVFAELRKRKNIFG